jgi:hypothetical protein
VFVEDFAAKLPTAPQFTVYASHLKDLAKASTSSARTEGFCTSHCTRNLPKRHRARQPLKQSHLHTLALNLRSIQAPSHLVPYRAVYCYVGRKLVDGDLAYLLSGVA